MEITHSTALVTGANRGLGARLVHHLLDDGAAKIYATARDPRTIHPTVAAHPRVHTLQLDVTDQTSIAAAAATAVDVSLLVNNAGVLGFGGALDGDLELFQRGI